MLSLFEALDGMRLSDQPGQLEQLTSSRGQGLSKLDLKKLKRFLNQKVGDIANILAPGASLRAQDIFEMVKDKMGELENLKAMVGRILDGTILGTSAKA